MYDRLLQSVALKSRPPLPYQKPLTDEIVLEPTSHTPFVKFSEESGVLIIKGKSIQVDMQDFYFPVLASVHRYLEKNSDLSVGILLHEINTSTTKVLINLFKYLQKMSKCGRDIDVKWFVPGNNPDMEEASKDLSELFDLNFKVILSGD